MNDERAVAAAIHAGLRSDDVTDLYTGDCRGCGECYKQGWPEVYEWEDGEDKPTIYTFDALSRRFGWDGYEEYGDTRYAADEYDEEFDFLGWHFHFWGDDTGGTPRYGATMSRDGETWECDYDCMFGAGFDDIH